MCFKGDQDPPRDCGVPNELPCVSSHLFLLEHDETPNYSRTVLAYLLAELKQTNINSLHFTFSQSCIILAR